MEETLARVRTHQSNILRYRRLLRTKLLNHEREYIETRLCEEQSQLQKLVARRFRPQATGAKAAVLLKTHTAADHA